MTRVTVPEGQTPLNDKLGHRLLDVFREGQEARKNGTGSTYHGHSLEHCIHAAGWVQQDLRMALDMAHQATVENYREPGEFGEGATVRRAEPTRAPTAYLVEKLDGTKRSIVDGLKYDPRKPEFWLNADVQATYRVIPLYADAEATPRKIAAYDDAAANAYLRATGSYRCFDEPGAVQMARGVLEGRNDD